MPPQPRGGRGSRGRGGDGRGRGDRGGFRGGGRGGPRGFQGRGRGGFPGPRYEAVEAPVYHPDPTEAVAAPGPKIAPGVVTVGVRRPAAPGTLGTKLTVTTNHFKVTIPESTIYQYHDWIWGELFIRCEVIEGDREMPKKWNQDLIRTLQEHIAPRVFTPRAVYDGRKNLFASRRLRLKGAGGDSQVFDVTLKPPHESERPPKVYRVKLKCVAEIDPALLKRYQEGQQSVDNMALTALTVMNVIIRMVPVSRCPFNTRSFFTDQEVRPVGSGIELWRGYLQSIRTGLHSMLINVDISTGMMFTSGPMIGVCQQILKNDGPTALDPDQGLNDRERICLQRFLTNVRFVTSHKDKNGRVSDKPKTVKKISAQSANNYMFDGPNGQMSVAQYFHSIGVNLRYSNYVCIETSTGAAYPIEFCSILPGQMMRKQVPPDVISMMLEFSTKKPDKRLNSIVAGHQVLQYGQSEYIREFGMSVGQQPEKCVARVLPTPALKYGVQSKFKMIRPANGSWNLRHQQLYEPADVGGAWAVIVYDSRGVREREAAEIICGLVARANLLGIRGMNEDPPVLFPPAEALNVHLHLQAAGQQVFQRTNKAPSLFLVVLPDNSQDLYQAIKHFGDVARGVATQCVRGFKSKKGSPQYWSGVCMKINAKLGGVNSTLDPNAQKFISDPESPVMIMGSDVMHPAPGAYGRPSFASMVGSIDSNAVHYTAVTTVQDSRVQIIAGVEDMVYEILGRHAQWKQNHEKKKNNFPKRIVYYRNGVSDGQFLHVLDRELPAIKAACKRHKINPTITVVVVRKRHHVRFFPTHGMADRSGNCPSGTVVDDVVAHPTEFNFYLQSQGGVIGTTRPTQYNVLHDENNFTMDAIQSLSFALCHVYARSTRAVSIPAPTYYADIVCERAKNHYDPSVGYASIDETDSEATASGGSSSNIQRYKDLWQPTHEGMRYKMYFL